MSPEKVTKGMEVSDNGETYRPFQLLFSLNETENIRFYFDFFENYFYGNF